ncbi:helix-turn-helix domain-containing protein [Hyphomonas sp. NPDC076900]|uniref:helix-turn-helix domain-containing protein n=1 Tax=unclassified Hyphomonas TaxID=2630699 RepID=UPI003D08D9CB
MKAKSEDSGIGLRRSIDEMLNLLEQHDARDGRPLKRPEGLCRLIGDGLGFRVDYAHDQAKGGFEFYRLSDDICVATVDMMPYREISRRHSSGDFIAFSAVLDGNIELFQSLGVEGELASGYCTIYGNSVDEELETSYAPGEHLKWVSIYLRRDAIRRLTGFVSAEDLPDDFNACLETGASLHCRNVPLSYLASMAAHQMITPPYDDTFLKPFLTAKALELVCHIMFNLSKQLEHEEKGFFSREEHKRLQQAMRLIRTTLDQPLNVSDIARATGFTAHRLQLGFRMVYGDTVGRIRDKVRMELALDLIRDSAMSMIEIALETGYEHPASFTRAFKAAYGISPTQMRNARNDELRLRNLKRGPSAS